MDNTKIKIEREKALKEFKSEMVAICQEQNQIINDYKKEIDSKIITKLRNDILA